VITIAHLIPALQERMGEKRDRKGRGTDGEKKLRRGDLEGGEGGDGGNGGDGEEGGR